MAKNGVVCIGLAVADILARPVDPALLNQELTLTDEISLAVGGDAFNEAHALAHLGIPVKLMATVGLDFWGDFIIKNGNEAGIDMKHVICNHAHPTTVSIVLIQHDGERNFLCSIGASMHFMMETLDMPSIRKAKVVSLASLYQNPGMNKAFLAAAKTAKEAGAIITLDFAEGLDINTLKSQRELLSLVDFVFPNYDQGSIMTGEKSLDKIAGVFLKFGVKNVVIKTGKNGCYIQNANEKLSIPTYKNAKCLDTTGAGDNFAAGFIYGLYNDLPLRECAAYANAVASVSIQYVGAGGVKSLQEVEDMMAGGILDAK
jgi:sugar/nucleoside kinase (ribokinase family)